MPEWYCTSQGPGIQGERDSLERGDSLWLLSGGSGLSGCSGLGGPCCPFFSDANALGSQCRSAIRPASDAVQYDQHLNCQATSRVRGIKAPCHTLCVTRRCTLHTASIFAPHSQYLQMLGWPGLCPVSLGLLLEHLIFSISFQCFIFKWLAMFIISWPYHLLLDGLGYGCTSQCLMQWLPQDKRSVYIWSHDLLQDEWHEERILRVELTIRLLCPLGPGSWHWSSTSCWPCNRD